MANYLAQYNYCRSQLICKNADVRETLGAGHVIGIHFESFLGKGKTVPSFIILGYTYMEDIHTGIPLLRWKFKFKLSHKTQSFKENCFVKTSQGVQKSRNNLMKTNFNFFFTIQPFII